MMRVIFLISFLSLFTHTSFAQQKTRQELEREKLLLKKEIAENEKIQEKIKSATSENLRSLIVVAKKAELQGRVVDNVAKDINLLDNNITGIQRDINKYDKLLDTLRQEYAKSMVYAYKNRGNYEFLNFIFSAENFNDAVKRIAYLKSYRTFREMQGQNILRTQELRRKRLEDLGVTKQTKTATLTVQEQEMKKIAEQKQEQDRIVESLRKQGKSIDALLADKKRREAKINGAIKAAIARDIAKAKKEENDRRIAYEKEERRKRDEAKRAKDILDKANRDANAKAAAIAAKALADDLAAKKAKLNTPKSTAPTITPAPVIKSPTVKAPVVTTPVATVPTKPVNVPEAPIIYTSPSTILNAKFEQNRGTLPWPVDNHFIIIHYGPYTLEGGGKGGFNTAVTIGANVGAGVKAVFDGEVIMIEELDYGKYTLTIRHGKYYTSYSNVNGVGVKLNQEVKTGQQLGKVAIDIYGRGSIDFSLTREFSDINPEVWLSR